MSTAGRAEAELIALAHHYAAAVDDLDTAAAAALFTDDGVLVSPRGDPFGELVEHRGRAAIQAALDRVRALDATFHAVVGSVVRLDLEAGTAVGRIACIAHHVSHRGDRIRDDVWHLHYLDDYRRSAQGWSITRRELVVDLTTVTTEVGVRRRPAD